MKKVLNADNLIFMLEDAGYEAYYVGGYVRDLLMQRAPGDIDIAASATTDEMKRVFDSYVCVETGIQHGTLTVLTKDGISVEITSYRTEKGYSDCRHPDEVRFVRDLGEDLGRRDFTMNSVAMDVRGNVIDLFGGRKDIRDMVIRAVGDPDIRFREDALRIMRALRFASTLDFEIEAETAAALMRNRRLLREISAERIYGELTKLVTGRGAGRVVRRYSEVLGVVLPELLTMKGFDQCNPYHRYDVLEHCIRTMERIRGGAPIKIAALFHDAGKPVTFALDEKGIGHMYGHAAAGEKIVREIMNRLRADKKTVEHVCGLVKYHDLIFEKDERLLKRWMNRYKPEFLLEILELKRADNFATGNMSDELAGKFDEVEYMIHSILDAGECFSLKDLVLNGNDIIALSASRTGGPWVGQVLTALLNEVIDGALLNERQAMTSRAEQLISQFSEAR